MGWNGMSLFKYFLLTIISMLIIMSCQPVKKHTREQQSSGAIKNSLFKTCSSPRPNMCTQEYNPVCAKKDTDIRCVTTPCPSEEEVTFGNACGACSDSKVSAYRLGECL